MSRPTRPTVPARMPAARPPRPDARARAPGGRRRVTGPKPFHRVRMPPRCWAAAHACNWRDPDGGACAHLLLFRADASWERLNVADTMKVPWQAYLGVGHPLLSDQGRVLATVVADTSGHHDALCGMTGAAVPRCFSEYTSTAWTFATSRRRCRCSRASGSSDGGGLTYTGSAVGGATVDLFAPPPCGGRPGQRGTSSRPRRPRSPTSTWWPGPPPTNSPARHRRARVPARPLQHRKRLGRSTQQ